MFVVYKIVTNDGFEYVGQSKDLAGRLKKHEKDDFKKPHLDTGYSVEILAEFGTREEALKYEATIVTHEYVKRPDTLNRWFGGQGGWEHIKPEHYAKAAEKKKARPMTAAEAAHMENLRVNAIGKKRPDHSEFMKSAGGVNRLLTEEAKAKSAASQRTPEARARKRAAATGNTNNRGKKAFNDGIRNYLLYPEDPKTQNMKLGRIRKTTR
ncbi:GIY-YIG nuclease family protein [Vibrio sp. WXL210]|uniref:GIY-YIG nuclease family protein n=1 Tax=Vibrio sp. WXL210 TaxID=3450709 RepID=UPI003EC4F8DA